MVDTVLASNLTLTCGVSGAVDLALRLFTSPGDQIVIEDPTFYEVKSFVKEYDLEAVPIPSTSDGFDVDELVRQLENNIISPKILYIISDFSNPRGITLNESKRKRLVELAYQYNFLVVSDEVYQLLYFVSDAKPPKPVALYDLDKRPEGSTGGVISVSSISKTVMPGLRLGWILCKDNVLLEKFYNRAVEKSGGLHAFYSAGICMYH